MPTVNGVPQGASITLLEPACNGTFEQFGVLVHTEVDGGVRRFTLVITDGPYTGEEFYAYDEFDAVSVLDQILVKLGYDFNIPAHLAERNALKSWLLDVWMKPSDFYQTYGC